MNVTQLSGPERPRQDSSMPYQSPPRNRQPAAALRARVMSRMARFGAVLALAVSFCVVQSGSPAHAAGVFAPLATAGNLCLQPASAADGAPIVTAICGSSPLQNWWPSYKSGTRYAWVNQGSGGCIYVNANTASNGGPLINATGPNACSVSNAEWDTHTSNLAVITKMESRVGRRNTGFCLDSPGYASPGDQLILWQCSTWPNQTFFWRG